MPPPTLNSEEPLNWHYILNTANSEQINKEVTLPHEGAS